MYDDWILLYDTIRFPLDGTWATGDPRPKILLISLLKTVPIAGEPRSVDDGWSTRKDI